MDNIWPYIGVALLAWAGWDLFAGYTVLHETIYRVDQPNLYWVGVGTWTMLALSCFTGYESSEDG